MSKPTTPLDSELAKIFGNNTRIFRAMRELFKQAGDLSPIAIEEALIAAGNAGTAANQALDVIERLTQAVELIALMPRDIDIKDDDLTPRQELVILDTLADLSPRFEQDPSLNTYAENPLTAEEREQLQNINSVTITNDQWGFVGASSEGPWTPEFDGQVTSPTSITYSKQQGFFKRIGNLVIATCDVRISAITLGAASGAVQVTGLPFTAALMNVGDGGIGAATGWVSGRLPVSTTVDNSTTTSRLFFTTATGFSQINVTDLSNSSLLIARFTYFAA